MKNLLSYISIALFVPILFSCNPECQNYTGINAEISPAIPQPGDEIMIKTTPADFLRDRELFIEKLEDGVLKIDGNQLESRFVDTESAMGRIAVVPADVSGNRNLYIRDDDCGGFIPLNSVTVADAEFIAQNQNLFITPHTPQIIIPSLPTVPPVNVINTWFSPNNRDYCIWFVPELIFDETTQCFKESAQLREGIPGELPPIVGNKAGSFELSAGCGNDPNADLYSANPVSGIIDHNTGYVRIFIDRTSKNLGVEELEGSLISPQAFGISEDARTVGDAATSGNPCLPSTIGEKAELMMVATSKQTGKQVIMYQYDVVGLGFHEKQFCN